jgi:DNA-binding response OmpR family regulator
MSKKLLLADDSITIQKVIGITFANEDYELVVVDNGDAALVKARSETPDLILADVFMPGKNGYELCAAVRQDPALRGVPVLLLTGTFEPFDESKAREVGADSWIAKPFESQALIDRVEELLARAPQPAPAAAEAPAAAVVAPAASDVPVSTADIWDDLAEIAAPEAETVSPVEFAAEAFSPVTAEIPDSDEDLAFEEDIWGEVSFDEEDLLAEGPSGEAAEDIWGSMDEDESEDEVPPSVFANESFSFEDDEEPLTAEAPSAATSAPPAMGEFIFEEEDDSFASMQSGELEDLDDDILPLEDLDILEEEDLDFLEKEDLVEDAAAPAEEPFFFAEEEETFAAGASAASGVRDDLSAFAEAAEPAEPAIAFEDEFALTEEGPEWGIAEEPGFVIEPAKPAAEELLFTPAGATLEPAAVAAPMAVAAVEERVRALSEDELAQIVERVAGAVIERLAGSVLERIAWEVVPDLAENLVKEEIRKIRQEA